jgi:hypothetical protein
LNGQKNNHIKVPISVAINDFMEYRNNVLISVQSDELRRCIPDLGENDERAQQNGSRFSK